MSDRKANIKDLDNARQRARARIADIVRSKITESAEWFEMGALVTQIEDISFDIGVLYEKMENEGEDFE